MPGRDWVARSPGGVVVKVVTVNVPEGCLAKLDALVFAGVYPSRAEAIRVAVRGLIVAEVYGKDGERTMDEKKLRKRCRREVAANRVDLEKAMQKLDQMEADSD